MPPFRIKVNCLDCPWHRQGWSLQTLNKADKHAQGTGHTLEYWRVGGNSPAHYIGTINPQNSETW